MDDEEAKGDARPCVLILDGEVVSRHVLAEYLRSCGYRVVEAASSEELLEVLDHGEPLIDTVLFDLEAPGALRGFALRSYLRDTHPSIDVIPAGSTATAAREAADLCEEGPQLSRPYDPQLAMDRIRRMRAQRERGGATVAHRGTLEPH